MPETDFQDIVNEAFLEADQQLAEVLKQGRSSGCTAIVAYIRKEGDKVRYNAQPFLSFRQSH